jgi:short subunit dehydrogenase-like uncharacterized protein
MTLNQTVAVFGAYGHTGRFVVSELRKRGWTPILSGRDADKLNAVGNAHRELEVRVASVDDPASLDRAISGARAVINCAGPFIDTAAPVIEAALRARIHYLDVAAEQLAVLATFERFADVARDAGIVIAPAGVLRRIGRPPGHGGDRELGGRGRNLHRNRARQLGADAGDAVDGPAQSRSALCLFG